MTAAKRLEHLWRLIREADESGPINPAGAMFDRLSAKYRVIAELREV